MRLAQITRPKKGRLVIPEAFGRVLGLYENSKLFCYYLSNEAHPEMILTTIPCGSWKTIRRISVQLEHRPGQLASIAKILSGVGANILLMEGYGYYSPEEQGWWSAVIDFPGLRGAGAGQSQEKINELAGCLSREAFPNSKIWLPLEEWMGAGRIGLPDIGIVGADKAFLAWIGSMDLQKNFIGKIEDENVPASTVRRNTIEISVNHGQGAGSRNLFMCNTEERFIRVGTLQSPAEIELEVRSEGGLEKVGVGILSIITDIISNFQSPYSSGPSAKKGFNIAFTYNYITESTRGFRELKEVFSETAKIKLFLEMPHTFLVLGEREQRRIWKALFRELLQAKRDNPMVKDSEPFVAGPSSRLIVWQRHIHRFRGNERSEVVSCNYVRRMMDWLLGTSRLQRALIFAFSLSCLILDLMFQERFEILKSLREPLVGFSFISLVAAIFPKMSH